MPHTLKLNALVSCLLALLFSVFFMYLKHNPALSHIAPFIEDPYDAVGSFAAETVIFLSLLALLRAFRPLGKEGASRYRQFALAHTELAVPLSVLLTVGSNAVAMARYSALWVGAPAASLLVGLQVGMALAGLLVGALVWLTSRRREASIRLKHGIGVRLVILAAILVLALYPENRRAVVPGALLSVEVGALVLFAPLWALGTALMPEGAMEPILTRPPGATWGKYGRHWGCAVVLAAMVGLLLVAAETTEGVGVPLPLSRLAFIASVYVGLEVVAVLIGFAFLRRWLGLFP
ncbi:MAG TPA: hypothetical protein VF784_14500 [Anaerolineales bacterium]